MRRSGLLFLLLSAGCGPFGGYHTRSLSVRAHSFVASIASGTETPIACDQADPDGDGYVACQSVLHGQPYAFECRPGEVSFTECRTRTRLHVDPSIPVDP